MTNEPETFRYSFVWQMIGWTFVALPFLFAAMMYLQGERIDARVVAAFVAMFVYGALTVVYYRRHTTTLTNDTLAIRRPFRSPVQVRWSDIVSIREEKNRFRFITNDQHSFIVNVWDPAFNAIVTNVLATHPELAASRP
jgi:hypothetical protein